MVFLYNKLPVCENVGLVGLVGLDGLVGLVGLVGLIFDNACVAGVLPARNGVV